MTVLSSDSSGILNVCTGCGSSVLLGSSSLIFSGTMVAVCGSASVFEAPVACDNLPIGVLESFSASSMIVLGSRALRISLTRSLLPPSTLPCSSFVSSSISASYQLFSLQGTKTQYVTRLVSPSRLLIFTVEIVSPSMINVTSTMNALGILYRVRNSLTMVSL